MCIRDRASNLAEDLRVRLSALRPPDADVPGVTVSIGVAAREDVDLSPTELMLRVDDRLYRAKRIRNAVYPERRLTVV